MKAALYKGKGHIIVKDIPVPQVKDGDILIKIKMASICGTDRKAYKQGHHSIPANSDQILGHEITGVIKEIGNNVEFYKPGMRIVLAPNVGCGHCKACNAGLEQLCPDYNAFGINWPGGFAEYLLIPEDVVKNGNLIVLPEEIDYERAALIEPLACCFNAYEAMDVKPGDTMLIFGAGPMGMLHLVLNKHLGIGEIIVVDIDESRLEMSKELGADYTVVSDENLSEKIMDITNHKGADVIITAASVPSIQEQAMELIAVNGNISFFAGLPSDVDGINFKSNIVHYKQLRVTGTTGASLKQFRRTVKLAQNDSLRLDKILTKKINLEELENIFDDKEVFSENIKIAVDMQK
jgi:threonine dehydrogenase-like Zn-dependent dehydrogenase